MSTSPSLVDEYAEFLLHHRGLASGTIRGLRRTIEPFLRDLGALNDAAALQGATPGQVRRLVVARAATVRRTEKRAVCSSVRGFLRFASMRGYVGSDLVDAVPIIRVYSLASLPRGLPAEDVEKLLASVDRDRPIGKRDYAALLLLATYGLRIGEVVRLRLEDIDWRRDRISFPHRKAGGPLVLPLTAEVGEALITYLREARPASAHPEVFLCAKGQPRPLSTACFALRARFKKYLTRTGIVGRTATPHALRHSLAARLLEKDEPLEVIAGLLGQGSLWSTFTYAKVDVGHLREVALDLPEVRS